MWGEAILRAIAKDDEEAVTEALAMAGVDYKETVAESDIEVVYVLDIKRTMNISSILKKNISLDY